MCAHVAIFSVPIPALVHPTLSLIETLVRRGFRVTYVTSERFAAETTRLGANVLRCPRLDSPFDQDDDDAMPIEHQYTRDLISLADRTLALTWPFFKRERPDLVVYDSIAIAGILVADRCTAPAVRMSNQFAYSMKALDCAPIRPEWKLSQIDLENDANAFLALHHSQRRNVVLDSTDPTFYCYLRELQLDNSNRAQSVFYAPRCTPERLAATSWRMPPRPNGPVALVTSSTTYQGSFDHYKRYVVELSRQGWATVLAAGSDGATAQLDCLPSNCRPVQNSATVAVMPHVDLIICGAGMATAMEAAYHGVPMLMLTRGRAEMEAYADRFEAQGMGVHLSGADTSPAEVARCASHMHLDPEMRLSIQRIQAAVRQGAGAEELANWLQPYVALRDAQ